MSSSDSDSFSIHSLPSDLDIEYQQGDLRPILNVPPTPLRGRSIEKGPLIPNSYKIAAVAAFILTVTLAIFSHYVNNGALPAPNWINITLKAAAGVVGSATAIALFILLPTSYYLKKQLHERLAHNIASQATAIESEQPEDYGRIIVSESDTD